MGCDYCQYTALVAAVTLAECLRNKWSRISLTDTTEMHAKFLIWKIGLRMRRWPEVRNLATQKFRVTPGPPIFQIWESDSSSDYGCSHRSNRNFPMFLLKNCMVWFNHAFLWLKSRNNTKQQEDIQ